jgi:hypothetical protein
MGSTPQENFNDGEDAGKLKSHIPVIAVTGNARKEYIAKGFPSLKSADIFSFIRGNRLLCLKPYEKQHLIDKIIELTGGAQN